MILFYLLAGIAVSASLLVIAQPNPIYGLLLLIASFGALSGLYVMLDAPLVAAIQIVVFFYLRLVVMMYMTPAVHPARFPPVPGIAGFALASSAVLVFYLGILPTRVLNWAAASISTIF